MKAALRGSMTMFTLLGAIAADTARADTFLRAPMPLVTTLKPGSTPLGYTAAPTPNPDIFAPQPAAPAKGEPGFSATLNPGRTVPLRSGQGYAPGSAFSEDLQRRRSTGPFGSGIIPGVNLRVPLD